MALDRTDYLDLEKVPFGKPETRYPTPNRVDLTVVESVPISPEKYKPLPYGSPHPTYTNSGLVLVWQGPVKATNNQIKVVRIYAQRSATQDWYNYALEYSGDVADAPIFVRTYVMLRTDYATLPRLAPFTGVFELQVTAGGSGYDFENPPTVSFTGGGGSGAAATVIVSPEGVVIGLELTNEGTGYTSAPTVVFSSGAAAATAIIQPTDALLVKETTTKLDSENPQLESLFIKVHRVYETLPSPYRYWALYDDPGRRGQVSRKTRSIAATLDGGGNPLPPPSATFSRTGSGIPFTVTKTWYEPRGESAIVWTQYVESWVEIHTDDKSVTSEFGGGILDCAETRDEPGAQTVETGFLVVSSDQKTISPDEQVQTTCKLDPSSAIPTLELTDPGSGYSSPPAVSFTGGTGSGATAHTVLAFPIASIAVNNGGSGYGSPPSVGFAGAVGGGALALAVLGFSLDDILVDNGGSGYTGPTVNFSGGGGSGAAATAVLGYGVSEIDVIPDNNSYAENYTDTPTVVLTGDGSGATAVAVMGLFMFDDSTMPPTVMIGDDGEPLIYSEGPGQPNVVDVTVVTPGTGYTSAPAVSFVSSTSTGAAATAELGSSGSIVGINITNAGSGYTSAPTISFTGDAGTGAVARAILAMTGSVISVSVINGGLYETTPTVVFIGGGGGSGAAATATLAATGEVYELILDTPGSYTVAPTVVFTGSNTTPATAIYHLGSALWPLLSGYWTDPVEAIVIDTTKQVVPVVSPHPPRTIGPPGAGPWVDLQVYDRWKSIQMTSKVDLSTLPLPEFYPTTWAFHLPPTLLSIEAVWDDVTSKLAQAAATFAYVKVESGTHGGIIVKRSSGFHGYALANVERIFFFGPPPPSAVPEPLRIIAASGSVRINHFQPSTQEEIDDDGGSSIGDSNTVGVTVIDVNDHLVGTYPIINPTHLSPPRGAFAESGGGSIAEAIAFGQLATMQVAIPQSTPTPEEIPPGAIILDYVNVQKWRFGVWIMELVYVKIPAQGPTI